MVIGTWKGNLGATTLMVAVCMHGVYVGMASLSAGGICTCALVMPNRLSDGRYLIHGHVTTLFGNDIKVHDIRSACMRLAFDGTESSSCALTCVDVELGIGVVVSVILVGVSGNNEMLYVKTSWTNIMSGLYTFGLVDPDVCTIWHVLSPTPAIVTVPGPVLARTCRTETVSVPYVGRLKIVTSS